MKTLALTLIAAGAAALAPGAASAQVFVHHPGYGFHPGFGHHRFGTGQFFGGFAFGGFFHQPQFHVRNWRLYGFADPGPQRRWVRHYDDAYLIDRRGYVHDGRYGLDWDRYGERWERGPGDIPYYVGDFDYHPDGRDYAHVARERGYTGPGYAPACGAAYQPACPSHGYSHAYRPAPPACGPNPGCGPAAPYGHAAYSYPAACASYAYAGCGTVIVTETIVTPGVTVTEEIIEEVVYEPVVQRRRAAPVRRSYKPRAPVMPPGERG